MRCSGRLQRIGEELTRPPVDWLAKYLPGLLTESPSKEVLPGVGHLSNVGAAEAFNREVRSFLRAVGTR